MKKKVYVVCLEVNDEKLLFMNSKEKLLYSEVGESNQSGFLFSSKIRDNSWYFDNILETNKFKIKLKKTLKKLDIDKYNLLDFKIVDNKYIQIIRKSLKRTDVEDVSKNLDELLMKVANRELLDPIKCCNPTLIKTNNLPELKFDYILMNF
jgi:hypothetical protein